MSAKKQVVWVDASGHVASMANEQALGYRSVATHPRNTVRAFRTALIPNLAVSPLVRGAAPQMTPGERVRRHPSIKPFVYGLALKLTANSRPH